ncbi:hypothetical protein [Streptomyces sp. CA-106131]|uniref:hypothetical protein n=1 Tax=Streptomyces sp. CA-106131 TaxID=3240045 RepID=UPI003D92E0C9
MSSVDRSAVDLDQWRKLIREHVTPAPRGTSVEWSDDRQGACVVYIDIPAQDPGCLFVVAAPTGKKGAPRTDTVAVPVREADGTHWLPRTELQRLLSNGVAASGMPTAQALAELLREAVAQRQPEAEPQIGQGLPSRQQEMREAYEQLRSAGLGLPVGEAYARGPAAIQEFAGREGQPGWVLCVVGGRAPVAVAQPVWQAIRAAGRDNAGGHPLTVVGYPVPGADRAGRNGPWAVPPDARSVDLDGGSWGAGQLVRSEQSGWRWEPTEQLGFTMSRYARNWTAQQPAPQLRLRALVTWPWADTASLQITPGKRQDLEQALPHSALAGAVTTMLSRRRGAELPASHWDRGPGRNTPTAVSYTSTITAPDDRRALSAAVMMSVDDTVVTCADVLLEDTSAWAALLPAGAGTQLGLDEVQALLLAAWESATETLPDAVVDPARMRWSAPPTTELRLSAEGPHDQPSPGLGTLIDLEALGPERMASGRRWPSRSPDRPSCTARSARPFCAGHWCTWRGTSVTCGPRKNCCRAAARCQATTAGQGARPLGAGPHREHIAHPVIA